MTRPEGRSDPPDPTPSGAGPENAPTPADATLGHGYLEGAGGLRLFFRAWETPRPRGRVVTVHGLGDHSGRYEAFARRCVAAGLSVYGLDLRGHGRSHGRRGHARSFDYLLRDLDRLRRRVGRPDERLWLFGHSLGGLLVLRYLQEFAGPAVSGAVSVAPFVRPEVPIPAWKLSIGALADRVAPAFTLDNEMERELLMREAEERQRHRSDPLVHRRISARMWGEMQRAATALAGRGQISHPVMIQVPAEDRVVDVAATAEVAPRLGGSVQLVRYTDAYHDLYHDPRGEEAIADALAFVAEGDTPAATGG